MILETISIDWRCKECGTVARIDIDDVTRAVFNYRPPHWVIDRGRVKCANCVLASAKVTTTDPNTGVTTVHQMQQGQTGMWPDAEDAVAGLDPNTRVDLMREKLSGLHAGRTEESSFGDPRRAPGIQPASITPGAGGISSGVVQQAPYPDQGTDVGTREFRPGGGNIVFADTRHNEFLGPEKTVAGVPNHTTHCIKCKFKIQDGTDGGSSEAWRLARNPDSLFERGHNACLDEIGR